MAKVKDAVEVIEGWRRVEVLIEGVTPTLMHNGELANPLNAFAKQLSENNKGRNKTDAQYEKISEIEFKGGLYLNSSKVPCWPGQNIERMIKSAAVIDRKGKDIDRALQVRDDPPLIYDGPKNPEDLWNDKRFVFTNLVTNPSTRGHLPRTRPRFDAWQLRFVVEYKPKFINVDALRRFIEYAGEAIGLSDWRPKYGQFIVKEFKEV